MAIEYREAGPEQIPGDWRPVTERNALSEIERLLYDASIKSVLVRHQAGHTFEYRQVPLPTIEELKAKLHELAIQINYLKGRDF